MIGRKTLLKKFIKSDISEEYISWLNDDDVVKYSNQRFISHTKESCIQYLASFDATSNLFLGVFNKQNHELIGTMTVYISDQHDTADIGILIGDKSVWGKGYGGDALITIINWLKVNKKLRKITAGTIACNKPMIKVMEKAGMHHEATRIKQELFNGKSYDILHYAIFLDED